MTHSKRRFVFAGPSSELQRTAEERLNNERRIAAYRLKRAASSYAALTGTPRPRAVILTGVAGVGHP